MNEIEIIYHHTNEMKTRTYQHISDMNMRNPLTVPILYSDEV